MNDNHMLFENGCYNPCDDYYYSGYEQDEQEEVDEVFVKGFDVLERFCERNNISDAYQLQEVHDEVVKDLQTLSEPELMEKYHLEDEDDMGDLLWLDNIFMEVGV